MVKSKQTKSIVPYRDPSDIKELSQGLVLFNTLYEQEKLKEFNRVEKNKLRNKKLLEKNTEKIIKLCLGAPKEIEFPLWFKLTKEQYQTLSLSEARDSVWDAAIGPWLRDMGGRILCKTWECKIMYKSWWFGLHKSYWLFCKTKFVLTEKST